MATYVPAKVSTQFIFYAGLVSQADTKKLQVNPTIAAGDFKVSIDGGALANLATLPAVTPGSSAMVKFTLSTSEMAGANVTIVCIDAAGAEWCDAVFSIQTSARQVDDLAFPNTSGRGLVVDANGLADANVVKVGPSGSGTAQTAGDIPARLPAALTANGNMKSSLLEIISTALTEGAGGRLKAAWTAFFDVAAPVLTTASVNQTGDSFARLGAPVGASHSADVAAVKTDTGAIKTKTDSLAFTVANQVDSNVIDWKGAAAPAMTGDAFARLGAPAGASVSVDVAAAKADTAAIKLKTDSLPASPAAVGSAMTLTSAYDFAKGTVAMVESYAAKAAEASPVQALYAILQKLYERSVSGTTETVKKLDGSTTAMTETLNDGTAPTAITRAT